LTPLSTAAFARESALVQVGLLDHVHRTAALVVMAGSFLAAMRLSFMFPKDRILIRWTYAVAGLASLQVVLGIAMAYVSFEPSRQVAHLTVASLLLGAETIVLLLAGRES
jgi:heme A synthase